MKGILLLIGICIPMLSLSQISDNFSDGDFISDPHWSGDSAHFEVSTSMQLHLKSEGADTSYLSTRNSMIMKTEWECWFKLSFNTSSGNYLRIYLASDNENLKGPLNGYYVRIGGKEDSLTVFRQAGMDQQPIFRGKRICTNHSSNVIRLRVLHDPDGKWVIYSDDTGGDNFIEEGSFFDSTFSTTAWFGFFCKYTTSNATKFYFDDLYTGPVRADTIAPSLLYITTLNSKEMELVFSEHLDKEIAENTGNYHTSDGIFPVKAELDPDNAKIVRLLFLSEFEENRTDSLFVTGICDLWKNFAGILSSVFVWFQLHSYDVVISEIMADPDPPAGLPVSEFVELFNRTGFPVVMKDWEFCFGSSCRKFPDVLLEAGNHLILSCDPVWDSFGKSVRIFSSASSLSNEGTTLVLKDPSGRVIHCVTYSKDWYRDKIKEEGGWSLEMIDPENPCGCAENWIASTNPSGGTPGTINSVNALNPDKEPPQIERLYPLNPGKIKVIFTESMDSTSFTESGQWELSGIGKAECQELCYPDYREVILTFPASLDPANVYNLVSTGEIKDCAGNILEEINPAKVALPDTIFPGDVVFNEILPDPAGDGSRFIEIFNNSEKVLDLKSLEIGILDTLNGMIPQPCLLGGKGFLVYPGDYLVLTQDPGDIMKRYITQGIRSFLPMEKFPQMNNEGSSLGLVRISDGKIIDRMSYLSSMHFPLLTDVEGVSLEKIHPGLPSQIRSNWHSASERSGFATPGYMNSQYIDLKNDSGEKVFVNDLFSPDNDGIEDVLEIRIHAGNAGYTTHVIILDSRGRQICQLARNLYSDPDEVFFWNGLNESGQKAPVGRYIIFVELVNPDGRISHFKKTVILVGRI
ncbi:MAG: lamin tail domain-containing protein [Bacteroidota bacterium]|nr:lamin tail domain-containing protein [Bacteroidota bacterium]